MSNILKMIDELCPDGVEYIKLEKVLTYEQPTKYIVKDTKYNDNFKTPVLTAGQSFILGYTNEENNIYAASKNNPVIIFDDFTTSFHWVNFRFKIKSSAIKILRVKDINISNFRYLYYAMKCINYIITDHKRHWIGNYSKIKIPLPPLAIQEEIARILDNFIELETELETELEARKKQYEYYRDKLLTFGDEVERVELGEIICSLKTGLNPRKNFILNTIDAKNYYITVRELIGQDVVVNEKTDKVNDEALELIMKRSNLEKYDILFSGTGTIGRTALIKNNIIDFGIKEGIYVIKPNISKVLPLYLLFFLGSDLAFHEYKNKIVGSPVSSLPMIELKKIKIPLPTLEKQQEIVDILDKFDTLCNDITKGLPAEIEARRKQYEYYREKLLNFNQK